MYKYRLNELFVKHFGSLHKEAKKQFATANGITPKTVRRDCALKMDNRELIPPQRILYYSRLFGINPSDLRVNKQEAKNNYRSIYAE